MSVDEVVRYLEEAGVKIPRNIKARGNPEGLRNYLKGRKKLLEVQVSVLEEKYIALANKLEEKRRQLKVLEKAIDELGGDVK